MSVARASSTASLFAVVGSSPGQWVAVVLPTAPRPYAAGATSFVVVTPLSVTVGYDR